MWLKAQFFRAFDLLKPHKGIFLGAIAILLFIVFKAFPYLAETLYRGFIYQMIRLTWDNSAALLPFPAAYVILPLLLILAIFYIVRLKAQGRKFLILLPDIVGWFVFLFMILWGFNYACRPSFGAHPDKAADDKILEFGKFTVMNLNEHKIDRNLLTDSSVRMDEMQIIQQSSRIVLNQLAIAALSNPRAKPVQNGLLRKLGITGIYFPLSLEAHYDESMLRITKIFVAAHELAHAYGITDEGEADFFAFSTLMRSGADHPQYAYMSTCALVELLRTIRSRLHQGTPELFAELESMQNESIKDAILKIRENGRRYTELFPGLQSKMNDQYLKTMGVSSGVLSYDYFIELAFNHFTWR